MKSVSDKLAAQKCALYVRVSTHWQIDKDSLPVQREELINYSKYVLGIDTYEIFEDAGYSGKNTDRPAFQQMMARLRSGEFSHLLVWKIDRISRNLLDFAAMYDELKSLGITFVSKNEQFDTSNAIGEAMLKIILVFAELERNMTSERVTAVMLSRASSGQWNGGKIPYGYDYDKETSVFSVNEAEAAVVCRLYDLYEESRSLLQVARTINAAGIRTRNGYPWNPTTVSKILKSPFYTGVYRYNYHDESKSNGNASTKHLKKPDDWILLADHHPAIIETERQERVIEMLSGNRRSNQDSSKTYVRKNVHIFAGMLTCGACGSQMQCSRDRPRADGFRPSVYLCSGKRRFHNCDNKYISDITVAPFVLNYIANIIKAQENFGRSTSIETFERKLLRGKMFNNVRGIEREGLEELYTLIKYGKLSDEVFTPEYAASPDNAPSEEERELLTAEKQKRERALARLQTLYLYSDEAMSEQDYLAERQRLNADIASLDQRLEEIEQQASGQRSLSDDEFMYNASVFLLTHNLKDKRFINYESTVRQIEPKVIRELTFSAIQKIVILNGKITEIRFRNGIEHKFLYHV